MPAVSKKKKPTRSKVEGLKMECTVCGKEKTVKSNYYKSDRAEYEETGYCNVCKECLRDMVLNLRQDGIEKDIFKNEVCKMLDIPFIPFEYFNIVNSNSFNPRSFVGEYKKIMVFRYADLRYNDSVRFENDESGFTATKKNAPMQVTEEMVEFWGRGFSADYYIDVQKQFDGFMQSEDIDKLDFKKQQDYKMLCHYTRKQNDLLLDKNTKPSDLKTINDAISKLSEDLEIKAIQKSNKENERGHYIVGLVTKYIEDVMMKPIPELKTTDWLGDMPKSEFDIEMAYFKSEMLDTIGKENKYRDIVEEDKKRHSPSEEELELNRLESDEDDD